jgi:putative peptidoglycan lipid II flippase
MSRSTDIAPNDNATDPTARPRGRRRLVRAAGWVGLLTGASRVLGMVRDMVIAALFAKTTTDAFFVAFTIPNVLRRLLAEGSLTVAFIPVFTDYRDNRGEAAARELVNATWTCLSVLLLGVSAVGVLAAPWLVHLFAAGFADDPARFDLAVRLTRVMFPYIFFVSLMALSMGVLNTLDHFTTPAVAPVLLNVMMIGSTAALWYPLRRAGYNPIYGLALGALVGGLVQLLMQLPGLARRGFFPRPRLDLRHPGMIRVIKTMAPAVFGLALYQVNVIGARLLASFGEPGSVTYLYYSQRLMELPMGVFAVAVATAAMPALSRHAAAGNLGRLKEVFADSMRLNFFIVGPATVGLVVLGGPIIAMIFERGEFTPAMTSETYRALVGFAVGLPAAAGIRLIVPVYYALGDSRTPVKIAAGCLAIFLGAGIALMRPLGHLGLALAISLSSTVNFALLLLLLRRRLGGLGLRRVGASVARSAVASGVMAMAAWLGWRGIGADGLVSGALGRGAVLLGVVIIAVAVYFGAAALLRCPELGELRQALRRRGQRADAPDEQNRKDPL